MLFVEGKHYNYQIPIIETETRKTNSEPEDLKETFEVYPKVAKDYFIIEDNGHGILVEKNEQGIYYPELAWGHARAGSNF